MFPQSNRYDKEKPPKRSKRSGKMFAIGLLASILLLPITITLLIATETGTRWLLSTVLSNTSDISIAEIKGRLVDDLSLKKLRYRDSNNFQVSVSSIRVQWQAKELLQGRLHINVLQTDEIDISGQPEETEDTETDVEILQLPLAIHLDQLLVRQLKWRHNDSLTEIQKLSVKAALDNNLLTVSSLELIMPQLQVNAHTTLETQPKWPLTAKLDWRYTLNGEQLHGKLNVNGDVEKMEVISNIQGAIESSQTGFIKLSKVQPEFNLQGQWKKLAWPLSGDQYFRSKKGDFKVLGTLDNYQTEINAIIAGKEQPDFSIAISGNGNQDSLQLSQLQIKPSQGQLQLHGHLSWDNDFAFDINLESSHLNPLDLGADIPGDLTLKADSKGKVIGDKVIADLKIKKLAGTLYNQPLNAKGQLQLNDQKISIKQLSVSAGLNHLQANGWLNQQKADLIIDIDAPNLQTAWPTWAGSLKGDVKVKGSIEKPIVKSKLKGSRIKYAKNSIEQVSIDADYVHGSRQKSNLTVLLSNAQINIHKIKNFILQGQGNEQNHSINLELDSSLADINILTQGQWNGKQWSGQIEQLDINHPQLKQWRLAAPAKLVLSQSKEKIQIALDKSCLLQNRASLCLSAHGSPDTQLNGLLLLSDWSLEQTKEWLPKELTLNGSLSAQGKLLIEQNQLSAKMTADISSGEALIPGDNNYAHTVPFSASKLRMNYQQDQLDSQLFLGLGNNDYLTANIKTGVADQEDIRQLTGSIKSSITNMKLIDGLVRNIKELKGKFTADLKIAGDTEQPGITGLAQFQEGQFKMPMFGTTFRNIGITLNADNNDPEHLHLKADVESGKGKLSAQGQLALQAEHNFPLKMNIKGEKFQISRLPEAEVVISPSLQINKRNHLTKIRGGIKVDSAQIEMKTLPEAAIAPSEDEIIVASEQTEPKKIDASQLDTHIKVNIGNKTQFTGLGLDTHLTGKLDYFLKNNQQKVLGRAAMSKATYRSYGQDLTIRKGEFLFNGPSDNPWLNIAAIRKADNEEVTAVLSVTGPLKSPRTKVYSEPALPESEALAYLITGKSIKRMSESEGSAVASAALNYGVGQLSWISDQLGIDEFEFKKSDKIEDSAVRLGQYLNPDLYVGVTMGLFANKYAANIRYRLSDHFSIRTRAGETQRIELKYQIETD